MKKNIILCSFLFILLFKYSNAYEFPDKIRIDNDFTVAKIGEDEVKMSEIVISANRLNKFLKDNFVNSAEWRLNYIKEIIIRKSLEKYAEKQGFDKNEDIKYQIEYSRTQILSNAVLHTELTDKYKITEKDKEKYFEENKSKFSEPAKIKVRYILVSDKEKGEAVLARLKKGEAFSEIAKAVSEDEHSKNNGGLLNDYLVKNIPSMEVQGITPEIINELFNLKKGETSRLAQSENKYRIFQIEETIPEQQKSYTDIKQQVDAEAEKNTKDEIISKLLKKVSDELSVTINITEINKPLSGAQK